ncbi:hypothetical protein PF005_g26881 [Phytophthora fragariae]|uniref:Uncharacterized protein n=2 Tax=Phytophthora fragariae TaxID=53985 RepID=A0A6A3VW97_9STRA|nr:hypothetical protein PF005_g26881 [Phytophthora fragariae]
MERRQQSGDGGTWQASAIPSTAEYEGERAVGATERVAAKTADMGMTESVAALTATVGKGNDKRVVIDTHAVLEALGVRNGGAPTQEELDAKVLGQLQAMMRMYGGDEAGDSSRSTDGSPEALQAALQSEQGRRDERVANILMTKAQQQTTNEVQTQEAERWRQRRQKRQERDKARRERRVERGRQAQDAVEGGVVQETASAGVADAAPRGNANHGEGAVVVFKRDPTEEDKKLREALDWSTQAARSLGQAEARVQSAKEGCPAFVVDDAGQCDKVTGEDTVNEDACTKNGGTNDKLAKTM